MSGFKPAGVHREKRLTAATIRTLTKSGLHADGNGLYLKVDSNGSKRWIQRIVINGKRRDVGLGSIALVSLAEAREAAIENRKAARAGADPIAAKRAAQAVLTFEEAAKRVHELNKPTWRNEKHGKQWIDTLDKFAFPFIGSKRISTISSADILSLLTPIWTSRPETARRVKQRVGTVMKWAVANGWRLDNPTEAIGQALPKHDRSKVKHREALPYDQVAAAITHVRNSDAGITTKLAFEFLVLTATRSGETREAKWGEFDLTKKVWTIPASRMKAKKAHEVPLSDRCLMILKEAEQHKQEGSDLVFPGTKENRPLSDMTLSKLMKELNIPAVPHGFRSSFRDWAGEQTHHPREVIEFALAHVIKDKAEAAYARSALLEKRRLLMDDWTSFLSQT
ncbi:tyrosine-type recombinase/integrase [Novosphingobium sp. Chol11]|uniref:tyrosine-type recombinase/integrase n=1 Tax=Novosphingobium sp. Chol11 TaxID=1385763 RepID=UPI000BE291D9|nr:integrase arm-type DNA-binding domain-containing protein [Novosphingobium sp. Chol11]